MATALPAFESALPALASLLLGKKTTTSSTANTDPLMQIFDQAMASGKSGTAEMQNLIKTIFTEGSAQIPQLTGAYANATGLRTTGNSGLKLALEELNKQMSGQAAAAVLQNQQVSNNTAANAAGNIAQATKGTTITEGTKKSPVGLGALGVAANFLDKKGVFKKLFGDSDTSGAVQPDITNYGNLDTSQLGAQSGDPYGSGIYDIAASDVGGGSADLSGLINNIDFSNFSPGGDVGGGDYGDFTGGDYGDFLSDVDFGTGADFGSFDFGDFFKNGGSVNRVNRKPKGYADGGIVTPELRNKNYTGARVPRAAGTTALLAGMPGGVTLNPSAPVNVQRKRPNPEDNSNMGEIGEGGATTTDGPVDANPSAIGHAVASALGMFSPVMGLVSNAVVSTVSDTNAPMNPMQQALMAIMSLISPPPPTVDDIDSPPPDETSVPPPDDDAPPPTMMSIDDANAATEGDGSDGGTSNGAAAAAAATSSNSSVGGDAFRNGGIVKGPGTGTSDSIDAKLSDGEYVIPADVVASFGRNTLDRIIKQIHTPA